MTALSALHQYAIEVKPAHSHKHKWGTGWQGIKAITPPTISIVDDGLEETATLTIMLMGYVEGLW